MPGTDQFHDFAAARSGSLLRTAYMLTHDRGHAEDLLQEALARSWFVWSRISGDPEAYVRKVLVTTYISQQRRRWRHEVPVDEFAPHVASAEDGSNRSDERDAMWRALGRLSPRQRAVVVLRYYEDLSEAQTATVLGTSIGTVKSQAAKGLARLRADTSLSTPTIATYATSEEGR